MFDMERKRESYMNARDWYVIERASVGRERRKKKIVEEVVVEGGGDFLMEWGKNEKDWFGPIWIKNASEKIRKRKSKKSFWMILK